MAAVEVFLAVGVVVGAVAAVVLVVIVAMVGSIVNDTDPGEPMYNYTGTYAQTLLLLRPKYQNHQSPINTHKTLKIHRPGILQRVIQKALPCGLLCVSPGGGSSRSSLESRRVRLSG